MIVERIVFRILVEGVATLRNDPRLLVTFLRLQGLEALEAEYIRDAFLERGLEIIQARPVPASKFPLVCVLLGGEKRAITPLDDLLGHLKAEDAATLGVPDLAGKPLRGGVEEQTVHFVVSTDNKDLTVGYYYLIKYVLGVLKVERLKEEGLLEFGWAGQDVELMIDYGPGPLFSRKLTLVTKSEEFGISEAGDPLRTTTGVYVDDGFTTTEDTKIVPFFEE